MTSRLKDPLSLLILLGFICQGFAWENYVTPVLTVLLWVVCFRLHRPERFISKNLEFFCLLVALLVFTLFNIGGKSVFRRSLDVGNALMVIQALWMLRPLSARERIYSLAMAVTQLAIGAQVIVDYEFVVVLGLAIILVPKALHGMAAVTFADGCAPRPFRLADWRTELIIIAVVMVVFFLVFPRGQIVMTGLISVGEAPLSPRLDMATTTASQDPDRTLFQISGENVGYLKSYALDTFDGRKWSASKASLAMDRKFIKDTSGCLRRRVDVTNIRVLGNALPTDGDVATVSGDFFFNRYLSEQGSVFFVPKWGLTEGSYEYWTRESAGAGEAHLSRQTRSRYTAIAKQSDKLEKWLDSVAVGETDPLALAKRIEHHLKTNFTYETGAPNLEQQNPLDDFIFDQRKGPCGRFASACAVLLRMRGMPSRVAIGYVPGEKNQFGDFHVVTPNDAHAWTEVHIEGKGWVALDATASTERAAVRKKKFGQSLYDWIEYVWYSKIVNLSEADQKDMAKSFAAFCGVIADLVLRWRWLVVPIGLLALAAVLAAARLRRRRPSVAGAKGGKGGEHRTGDASTAASGFYGMMLKLLAKKGFRRKASQTPWEFQNDLAEKNFPRSNEARIVTEAFCDVKYGGKEISPTRTGEVKTALQDLRK